MESEISIKSLEASNSPSEFEYYENESTATFPNTGSEYTTDTLGTPSQIFRKKGKRKDTVKSKSNIILSKLPFFTDGIFGGFQISKETQQFIGCEVGLDVSPDEPWKNVPKTLLEEHITIQKKTSEFYPIRALIKSYNELPNILFYFDGNSDIPNEFYVCTTKKSYDYVQRYRVNLESEINSRVQRSIIVEAKKWYSYGSEKEVNESIPHNTRSKYVVEAETTYKELNSTERWGNMDSNKDPSLYAYFGPLRINKENVIRNRFSSAVQITPSTIETGMQTAGFSKHNYGLQYKLEYDEEAMSETYIPKHILNNLSSSIEDAILFNERYNIYRQDYQQIIYSIDDTKPLEKLRYFEYQTFLDITYVPGRSISYLCWHPTLTGVCAISYINQKLNDWINHKVDDFVYNLTYRHNFILIWTFLDTITPKLILECPREVFCVKYCPYNPNILIGGMNNGQVILWDLTDRLSKAERQEVLTSDQMKFKIALSKKMEWMKSIKSHSYIPVPTATSCIDYSHMLVVSDIIWLPPSWTIMSSGIIKVSDTDSLTFVTSSNDGLVLFWDLKQQLNDHTKKASASESDTTKDSQDDKTPDQQYLKPIRESPYAVLNRKLKPIYKLIMQGESPISINLLLSTMAKENLGIEYNLISKVDPDVSQNEARLIYEPIIKQIEPCHSLALGTYDGRISLRSWEGRTLSTGALINSETIIWDDSTEFHDGPVYKISRSLLMPQMLLSIGGKIHAVWIESKLRKPVFWKRAQICYSSCGWSSYKPSEYYLMRIDGMFEVWDLLLHTERPIIIQSASNNIITGIFSHTLEMPQNVIAITENNGVMRIFNVPENVHTRNSEDLAKFQHFVDRELEFYESYENWLEEWKEKKDLKTQQQVKTSAEELALAEEELQEKIRLQQEEAKKKKLKKKTVVVQGTFDEWLDKVEADLRTRENKQMVHILLAKKRLLKFQAIANEKMAKDEKDELKESLKQQRQQKLAEQRAWQTARAHLFSKGAPAPIVKSKWEQDISEMCHRMNRQYERAEAYVVRLAKRPQHINTEWNNMIQEGIKRRYIMDGYRRRKEQMARPEFNL